jgi:hypothetical protein
LCPTTNKSVLATVFSELFASLFEVGLDCRD